MLVSIQLTLPLRSSPLSPGRLICMVFSHIQTILWSSCCFVFADLLTAELWKQKLAVAMPIPASLQLVFPDVSLKSSQGLFLCRVSCVYLSHGDPVLRWLCSPHPSHLDTNWWISFHHVISKTLPVRRNSQGFLGRIRLILLEPGNLFFKRGADVSPHQPADSEQGGSSGTKNRALWPVPGLAPSWQH